MEILELTNVECLDLLRRRKLGRLACARDNQPYIVPIYFAYHENHLYSFATLGQKIEWMRSNPLVCVEVDEIIDHLHWKSVIVRGRYQELRDTPESEPRRELAHQLLQDQARWWEPAYVKTAHLDAEDPLVPLYFRIHIDQMSGRRAEPDLIEKEARRRPVTTLKRKGWLKGLLRRARLIGSSLLSH